MISRRNLLAAGAASAGLAVLGPARLLAQPAANELRPMTGDVVPIGRDEHLARIAKAQRLMGEAGLSALLIEPGASMIYFTGVQWHLSERLTAAIIPREGEPCIVTPHFEEPSVR
jgi:Xaa-Pro dipeptidase